MLIFYDFHTLDIFTNVVIAL